MSSKEVRDLLDGLEAYLEKEGEPLDAGWIQAWDEAFRRAAEGARQEPDWGSLVARSQALGARVQGRVEALEARMESLKEQLELHAQGARALRAYRPG